jgi:hypothetical protein
LFSFELSQFFPNSYVPILIDLNAGI